MGLSYTCGNLQGQSINCTVNSKSYKFDFDKCTRNEKTNNNASSSNTLSSNNNSQNIRYLPDWAQNTVVISIADAEQKIGKKISPLIHNETSRKASCSNGKIVSLQRTGQHVKR